MALILLFALTLLFGLMVRVIPSMKDAGEKTIRVSKVGKITALRKGRSTVCVMAKNGMGVKVRIWVKDNK